jgi:hypothetical protein
MLREELYLNPNDGIKFLRATLPADFFDLGFKFLKGFLRDVFISRSTHLIP